MTVATTERDMDALTALKAGQCSASCALSQDPSGRCRCRGCQGAFHGALARYITAAPQPGGKLNRAAKRRLRKAGRAG